MASEPSLTDTVTKCENQEAGGSRCTGGKAEVGPAAFSQFPAAVEWLGVLERQLPAHVVVQGQGGAASAVDSRPGEARSFSCIHSE